MLLYQKKNAQRLLVKSELSFKVFYEAHWLQKLLSPYLEGAFVDTENVTCLFNIKSYMELHPTTNKKIQFQASDLVKIKQKLQGPSK